MVSISYLIILYTSIHTFCNFLIGSLVASEAIYEAETPDNDLFNTKAQQEMETNSWVLNGTKSFVVCPPMSSEASQLFLTVAQTQQANIQNEAGRTTTLFLIDSNTPGVTLGQKHQTLGCRATTTQSVIFENVRLPDSCVLGNAHEGHLIAEKMLRTNRLRTSMISLGMAKSIFNYLTEYCIEKNIYGVGLK